jgi:hypothetical protein
VTLSGPRAAGDTGVRAVDVALVVVGLAIAAGGLFVNLDLLLRLADLPPTAVSNPWVRADLTTLRVVGVVTATLLVVSRIVVAGFPAMAAKLPAAIDGLVSSAGRTPFVAALILATIVLAKTALQLVLWVVGFSAYGADDFSRTLSADYWLFFKRLYFGWTGWIGLSGSGWLPFPDYLFGLALAVHRDLFVTPRLLNLVISAILVVAVYLLGRDLFGRTAGLLAAALVAFQPWQVWLGVSGMTSDLSSIALMVGFAVCVVRWLQSQRPGTLLWAAAFLGISNGFRFENWIFSAVFGVLIVVMAARDWRAGRLTSREVAAALAAFVMMGAFPIFWMAGSYLALGDWLPSLHAANAWMVSLMPGETATTTVAASAKLAVSQSPNMPQISMVVLGGGAFPAELGLAALGIIGVLRARDRVARLYFLVVAATAALFFLVFRGTLPASIFYARYLLVFPVLLAPYAGRFVSRLLAGWGRARVETAVAACLVVAAVATLDAGRSFNYPSVFPKDAIGLGWTLRSLEQAGTIAPDAKILIERDQDWGDLGIVALANRPERFVALGEFEYQRQADLSLPSLRARALGPTAASWHGNVRGDVCDNGFASEACRESVMREHFDLVILSSPDRVASFAQAFGVPSWQMGRYAVFDMAARR